MIDPNILSKAIAGIEPAFFGSEFHPDVLPPIPEISGKPFDKKEADLALLHRIQRTRRAAPPEAGDSSLVQRRKSPTLLNVAHPDGLGDIPVGFDHETGEVTEWRRGARARLYFREWSDEYRVRVEAQTSVSNPPEANSGERETAELSSAGARKIMESGAYVQVVRGGFTTFLTLTFEPAARARIISGETTIGAEVSRFFDAAKQMYRRGWAMDNEVLKSKNGYDCFGAQCIPDETSHDDEFDYIWCAEMPKNKQGEPNPHCHILLRWSVPEYLFFDWAFRIERLWGFGFANLQRIHTAEAAAGYLLKALGYMAKGHDHDQGVIRGNRYNISKSARAPKWECIASFYADNMTAIINELRDRWHWEDAPTRARIADAKEQIHEKSRAYMVAKHQHRYDTADKLKHRLEQLTDKIKSGWQKLRNREARADEYQITMKGSDRLHKFLTWATARRGWRLVAPDDYELPDEYQQTRINWIKDARKMWRNAAKWAGFNWFYSTHELVTVDAGTMADYIQWEQLNSNQPMRHL